MNLHGRHMRGILDEIGVEQNVSQRRLAHRLGIALGLTNLLLKRVVAKGWVKVVRVRPNRVLYLLTPAGIAAKARLTREYLQGTLQFYTEARERIRERFADLSGELKGQPTPKRIVFFGAGETAEIGYVSLQETDLELVGVVDAARTRPFFGLPIDRPSTLTSESLSGRAFDRLVVMSLRDDHDIRRKLERSGIAADRIFWL